MSIAIPPGCYRHFKGNEYTVIGVAKHSETDEEFVVYRAEYACPSKLQRRRGERGLWVRPVAMWAERVIRDGYDGPRFVKID